MQDAQHHGSRRALVFEDVVQPAEARVGEVMIDVEHVAPLERGQKLTGARAVAHVAENPERVRGQIRRQFARHPIRIGQKAQVAGHRILLEVIDPLAQRAQRQTQRETGAERVAVGLHVRHEDESLARAQFAHDLIE